MILWVLHIDHISILLLGGMTHSEIASLQDLSKRESKSLLISYIKASYSSLLIDMTIEMFTTHLVNGDQFIQSLLKDE
jgi:hypothetical protein